MSRVWEHTGQGAQSQPDAGVGADQTLGEGLVCSP